MGSACRARFRGKRVKSAFFETCGQPPEKEGIKKRKIGLLEEVLLTIVRLKNYNQSRPW
jgi:hypothetical protein